MEGWFWDIYTLILLYVPSDWMVAWCGRYFRRLANWLINIEPVCLCPSVGVLDGWAAFSHVHLIPRRELEESTTAWKLAPCSGFIRLYPTHPIYKKVGSFQSLWSTFLIFNCLVCGTSLEVVSLIVSGIEEIGQNLYLFPDHIKLFSKSSQTMNTYLDRDLIFNMLWDSLKMLYYLFSFIFFFC